ncbi:MAG: transposase [Clostridia bacterium]|nr:transposase [Clostridia bacterium]
MCSDFMALAQAKDRQDGERILRDFVEKWGRTYSLVKAYWDIRDTVFAFLSYPEPIRKAIYTSNAIESFNSSAQTMHIRGFGQLTDEERTAMG